MKKLNARQRILVEQNLHLISPIAQSVGRKLPFSVTLPELDSIGYQGLCQAVTTHDAAKGPFNYWAKLKIHGAMIDANKGSHYPRRWEELLGSGDGSQPVDLNDPERILLAKEHRQQANARLSTALRTLNKVELRIVEASDNEVTLGEIAEELGVGITTVHRRREAIYAKLRRILVTPETNGSDSETRVLSRKCYHRAFKKSHA